MSKGSVKEARLNTHEDVRDKKRLSKLVNDKSIKAELNFYQLKFKGGKTKSVKNRIVRLEQALKKERNE
jgi:hypothetical protein